MKEEGLVKRQIVCEILLYDLDYATGYAVPDFLFPLWSVYRSFRGKVEGKKRRKNPHQYLKLVLEVVFHKTEITQSDFFCIDFLIGRFCIKYLAI